MFVRKKHNKIYLVGYIPSQMIFVLKTFKCKKKWLFKKRMYVSVCVYINKKLGELFL